MCVVFFLYNYCLTTILNIFLSVHLGGAGCQIEGREDTSRPGKNQRGTGQKGRNTFCPFVHAGFHSLAQFLL